MQVGDRWKYEQSDRRTGVKQAELERIVTAVSASQIEGTDNGGKLVMTPELNAIESPVLVMKGEAKFLSFPLEVGKKWESKYSFTNKQNGTQARWQFEASVVAVERVKEPAGEFEAFKIEYKGYWNNDTTGGNGSLKLTSWYAPAARNIVRFELADGYNYWVRHLVDYRVQP